MRLPLSPSLGVARAAGAVSRLRGGGGTSVPGKVLLALRPDAIGALARRLSRGAALISATNGKTTTAALAASALERSGLSLVHNSAGANMEGGIASTLLSASGGGRGGRIGEIGLFEVDEAWLPRLTEQVQPRAILLGNLFRDQLDRYGELETIAERWAQTLSGSAGNAARLVLNADDPLIADLGRQREDVVYFGVEDDSVVLGEIAHAADAKRCRRCGAPYAFDAIYLGHLGRYHCPSCGQARPQPQVTARDIELRGVRAAAFTLSAGGRSARIELSLPGLYNVYNALGAAALCISLGLDLEQVASGIAQTRAAFGRGELVSLDGRQLHLLLVKNPAGANEVLRTLALEPGEHDLLCVLNDRIADGRDVSWIWDADFEMLSGAVRRVTCAGTRAAEIALRLKYAGIDPARIEVAPSLEAALAAATDADERGSEAHANRRGSEAYADGTGGRSSERAPPPLYVLPTYTAMLELRRLLVRRGAASEVWSA